MANEILLSALRPVAAQQPELRDTLVEARAATGTGL